MEGKPPIVHRKSARYDGATADAKWYAAYLETAEVEKCCAVSAFLQVDSFGKPTSENTASRG